jgi:Tfp pilus assembly protein PilN
VNRGVLCAKGSAGLMQHYSPARLTRPLLRTGERGKGEFKDYETKIVALKEESARLAPQLAKIRKLQAEREEVNKRLGIIASLDKNRYLHVRMMNDLAVNVPDNCWLTQLSESGGTRISLEGVTFSNFIIADFMTSLEGSGRFSDVALVKAQEGEIDGVRVVKFAVNAALVN